LIALRIIETQSLIGLNTIYKDTESVVIFLQLWVFMDLLHDSVGIVPPPDMNFFVRLHCKVLRRAHIYFVALYFIPEVQQTEAAGIMIALWGLLDLIRYIVNNGDLHHRYPFYAMNTFKVCPEWLVWLRYSEFLILYPIGFVSEGITRNQ
jgi:very-long-chain (3R)-3-hydroxyacyl-CoA dehydratase